MCTSIVQVLFYKYKVQIDWSIIDYIELFDDFCVVKIITVWLF